jgi:hypothetical protein
MSGSKQNQNVAGSFRDPSGFLFYRGGILFRQINYIYKKEYDFLIESGLYRDLSDNNLLIRHTEVDVSGSEPNKFYKVIRPEKVLFISYPYEWCFSQLKDAALTTLEIQKRALSFGMSLKDCSVYNIQFKNGKPIFIDTLSFERYNEGRPWVAYRQFCQHFLAPLALMNYKDIRLSQLLRIYIDGVPLNLASSLLPARTHLNFSLLMNIHLHAKAQKHYSSKTIKPKNAHISCLSFKGLIDNLESIVKKLKWKPRGTEWGDYYKVTNYSSESFLCKKQIISDFLDKIKPNNVWDLGSNTGIFSRIASDKGIRTISFDIDPAAVEINYLESIKRNEINIFPLLLDLTNPSPGIGWENQERVSLLNRDSAEMVFALALIHHLAISNNVPFSKIGDFFSKICNFLIIEFIPKNDSQVQRLLSTREDIFSDYTQRFFENEFDKYFTIQHSVKIKDSERTVYLMRKR